MRVLDVPARYATGSVLVGESGVVEPVGNGGPSVVPSVLSPRDQVVDALRELAQRDGWAALYDPTDESTTTVVDGHIVEVRDSLGNLPPLTGDAAPSQLGAVYGFEGQLTLDGLENSDLQIVTLIQPHTTSVRSVISNPSINGVFSFYLSQGRLGIHQMLENWTYYGAEYRDALFQDVPTIVSYHVGDNTVRVGTHDITPDIALGQDEPIEMSHTQLMFGQHNGLNIGPILVAESGISDDVYQRAVELLSALSGAPSTIQQNTQRFAPSGYATTTPDGNIVSGFRANRPEILASLTKLLTVYLARQIVPASQHGDLIEFLGTSSGPVNLRWGDKITWTDAFHISLLQSVNTVTRMIARHAGNLIDPEANSGYDTFIDHMNATVQSWGWDRASFTTADGLQENRATAAQICELLHRIHQDDPDMVAIMGAREYEFTVVPATPSNPNDEPESPGQQRITNIIYDGVNGVPFPEMLGAKGGALTIFDDEDPEVAGGDRRRHAMAILWQDPVSGHTMATTLLNPGGPLEYRYEATRQIMDTTRSQYQTPTSWSADTGSQIDWSYDTVPYIAATSHPHHGAHQATVRPFDIYGEPLPDVAKGATITITARIRAGAPGNRVTIAANLGVGVWEEGGSELSTTITPTTTGFHDVTLTGEVRRAGVLDVTFTAAHDKTPSAHIRDTHITIDTPEIRSHVIDIPLSDYTINQDSTPTDSTDTSGSVGEFTAVGRPPEQSPITTTFGAQWLKGREVLISTSHNTMTGEIRDVTDHNGTVTMAGTTLMSRLQAYNVQALPYQGSLLGLIQNYLRLSPGSPLVAVGHPDLIGRRIVAPGWQGELWFHLKQLCAAEKITLRIEGFKVFVEPIDRATVSVNTTLDVRTQDSSTTVATHVEVTHRNNRWVTDHLVWPHGGWGEGTPILSVNPGEFVVQELPLQTSLESFITPRQVDYVAKGEMRDSVFTVVGDDGLTVTADEFHRHGGYIRFSLDQSRQKILVFMQGPTGVTRPDGETVNTFSMASRFGDSADRYSTLRILGTGVTWDEHVVRFPTGAGKNQAQTEVGVSIDNIFLTSMRQVVEAGTTAARKHAGYNPTMSLQVPTQHDTITPGQAISHQALDYRVRSVSTSPATTSVEAEYQMSHETHQQHLSGTYQDVHSGNEGLTYTYEQKRGKYAS